MKTSFDWQNYEKNIFVKNKQNYVKMSVLVSIIKLVDPCIRS